LKVGNNAIYTIPYNRIHQAIIAQSLPKDFVESTTQFFDHKSADELNLQGWLFELASDTQNADPVPLDTYPKTVPNCTSTATAHFTIALDTLTPLLSNIPVFFWNMGKIELQLTFANVFDSLYFYAPAPARTSPTVNVVGVFGSSPFPSGLGDALVPFNLDGGIRLQQDLETNQGADPFTVVMTEKDPADPTKTVTKTYKIWH
jgi:hypothetical protein